MNKKLVLIVFVLLLVTTSYAGVVGIIPQGKKINGQMDKNSLVNVSRVDLVNFLKDGTIPSHIKTTNIYYTPWATNPAVRKKFSKLLSDKLCQKMGITQPQLLLLVMDESSVIESLQPGDTVYSNGIDIGKNQLVPAPPRAARMTSNGMEQVLIFPDGTAVYMTCLNVDITDEVGDFSQIGEEGFEDGQTITKTNEALTGDTIYCVTQEHITNVTDTIIKIPGKIVQEIDTVHIKKEPVYIYKKETFVTNQKKIIYVQEPDQVKKKIVYVITKVGPDPCINCNEQQSYKINNNCPPKIKINNNCNTGNNQNIKIVNSGATSQTSTGTGNIKIVDGSKTTQSYGNIRIVGH